ncbi:MAG TPA: efflux RND transporter permease subunit [Gemmatimonadales bacterium]|nr:efflux RND transporter permease subunit [Gemmatimonadales bacterium]
MLTGLVRSAIRHRGVVLGLAAALVVVGADTLNRAPLDVFPEFAPPQVSIQTEAPGLSPEQVELQVTKLIEGAINGVQGIAAVRSQSIQGLSVVTAVLAERVDIHQARQALAERLAEAAVRLPATVEPPVLTPLTSSSSTVLVVGITSASVLPMAQRSFADWVLKPRLLAVPGVSKVAVFGGEVRQLQVQLDPERLRLHGVGIAEITEATRRSSGLRGGGVIDQPSQRLTVRSEGQASTPADIAATVVREREGLVLRLGDLGRVTEAPETRFGEGGVNGERGLVIVVSGQLGVNTKVVAARVEATLARLRPTIESAGLELHPALFRPSEFIDLALRNITTSLLLGAVLVAVVLLLFLADARAAAISLTAIPLSLLAAILALEYLGFGINTLTLGGLAIALGEVVDDAIIDVENIARRLRLNRARPDPRPAARVVLDASIEVRSSVVYATFVVALVFVPVLLLTGVQGALFRPLALSYILATMASLLVALTVTPALTLLLLVVHQGRVAEAPVLTWLKRGYRRALVWSLSRPALLGTVVLLVCGAAAATVPFFGATFLPEFREGHYLVHMSAVPGTSLDESLRLGQRVTDVFRADPRVRSVAQRIGRAELSEDTWGTHYTEFEVSLVPLAGEAAETVEHDLRAMLLGFPGVNFAIRGFLSERIEETLTGSTAELVVRLFGDDLDSLDLAARRVAKAMAGVPGTIDVSYDPPAVTPEVTVRLRPYDVAAVGLRPDEVLEAVEVATRGVTVSHLVEANRSTAVTVTFVPEARARPEDLRMLPVVSQSGRLVELQQVADIARTTGRSLIMHVGTRRVQTVTANVAGGDTEGVTRRVETRLSAGIGLPAGVYAEVGGTAAAHREARRELLLNSVLAGAGIIMLLWLAFGERSRLSLVLANLPFALVGGVLAVSATGGVLSLGSLVGFVTLFGIATRNAVMLVSHYDHLVWDEGKPWGVETAARGAMERLGPILMTALVTALGLLPLAIGSGDPGREIEGPMAIVILGGLITSTVLTLFVLPTLALRFGRFSHRPHPDAEALDTPHELDPRNR